MRSIQQVPSVYLIHFDERLTGRSQHYIGWAMNVTARLRQHKNNQGARILEVCNERGIGYQIARVWKWQNRSFERRLKNRKNARVLCPVCNPTAYNYPVEPAHKPHVPSEDCPF